jgi:hypothetical protein
MVDGPTVAKRVAKRPTKPTNKRGKMNQVIKDVLTDRRMKMVLRSLLQEAREGSVPAMKELLARRYGPTPPWEVLHEIQEIQTQLEKMKNESKR